MFKHFVGRAPGRVRLGAAALACAWPLANPLAATPAAAATAPNSTLQATTLPTAEPLDWRQANDAVGRFLRGHIDLLKAEPEAPPPVQETGQLLSLEEALTRALASRPDLFERPGLSPGERLTQRREVLALRLKVQQLWSRAVLTARQAQLSEEAASAAQTGAELGRRMAQVGNWSRAQWLQEHAQWLDAQMALDQARVQALQAREALVRELTLTGEQAQIRLPASLPQPPAEAAPLPPMDGPPEQVLARLLAQATQQHTAVALARWEAQRTAQSVGNAHLERAQAALQRLAQQASEAGAAVPAMDPTSLGWSHALERALTAAQGARAQEAELQSAVRTTWQLLRQSQARSAQLGQLLTLQTELLADMQRRYNGMLKSTWDLLASARERMAVEQRLLQAQQQQWLAQAALLNLLAGGAASAIESDSAEAGSGPRRSPGH